MLYANYILIKLKQKSNTHLLNVHYMPGIVLNTWSHLVHTTTIWSITFYRLRNQGLETLTEDHKRTKGEGKTSLKVRLTFKPNILFNLLYRGHRERENDPASLVGAGFLVPLLGQLGLWLEGELSCQCITVLVFTKQELGWWRKFLRAQIL